MNSVLMDLGVLGGLIIAYVLVPALFAAVWVGYPLLSLALGWRAYKSVRSREVGSFVASAVGLGLSVVMIGLPFADYPSKKRAFDAHCERDAGLHILRTVAEVEGIHGIQNAVDYGYSYGELYRDSKSKTGLTRYYKPTQSNKTYLIQDATEISPYGYRWAFIQLDEMTWRSESQIFATATDEVLSRSVSYFMSPKNGNKDASLVLKFFHAVREPFLRMDCPDNPETTDTRAELRAMLNKTLLPRSR